jgi:hypothetical protein
LGKALESDPELQRLAIEHGLRTADLGYFRAFITKHSIPVAVDLVDVIETPSYEIIEAMIRQIEQNY